MRLDALISFRHLALQNVKQVTLNPASPLRSVSGAKLLYRTLTHLSERPLEGSLFSVIKVYVQASPDTRLYTYICHQPSVTGCAGASFSLNSGERIWMLLSKEYIQSDWVRGKRQLSFDSDTRRDVSGYMNDTTSITEFEWT